MISSYSRVHVTLVSGIFAVDDEVIPFVTYSGSCLSGHHSQRLGYSQAISTLSADEEKPPQIYVGDIVQEYLH